MNKATSSTRISPVQFIRQARQEWSKVTWPSRRETLMSSVTVFIMVVIVALFFFFVDMILRNVIGLLLGLGG